MAKEPDHQLSENVRVQVLADIDPTVACVCDGSTIAVAANYLDPVLSARAQ